MTDPAVIAVLIPVLNRPSQAAIVADSIRSAQTVPTLVVFVCTPGDSAELQACEATGETVVTTGWQGGRGDYARKINLAASLTDAPYLFTAADDVRFTRGWDSEVLAVAERREAGVVGTIDNCNPRTQGAKHSTHSLVARWYMDEHGTIDGDGILYEGYWHNFCDDELLATANARRAYRPSRVVVQHLHPTMRSAPDDDTYRLGAEHFHADRQLFWSRRRLWQRQANRRRQERVRR